MANPDLSSTSAGMGMLSEPGGVQCSSWGRYLPHPGCPVRSSEAGEFLGLRDRMSGGSEGLRLCPSMCRCAARDADGYGMPGVWYPCPRRDVLQFSALQGLGPPPGTSWSSGQDSG